MTGTVLTSPPRSRAAHADTAPIPGAVRAAPGVLALGMLACALAAVPGRAGNAERFANPKEIVLHLVAAAAAALLLSRARQLRTDRIDACLALFALLGVVSSVTMALNGAYALRALGITLSSALVFWAARSRGDEETGDALTAAAAVAAALVAASALLEAYGVLPDLSGEGRAPGGLMGNRNRMAHFVALGLPVALLHAARVHGRARLWAWSLALAAMTAAVVLSRSRGAWLAVGAAAVVALAVAACRPGLLRQVAANRRAWALAAALALGAAGAVLLPNTLQWRSSTPYLDSLRGIVDAGSGSGQARRIQAGNNIRMAMSNPLLGVGPGNWTIQYPRYTGRGDPSYTPLARIPTNRLPHGDWTGLAAERGIPAFFALGLLFLLAARGALGRATAGESGEGEVLRALALLGTLAALAVAGALDPVLLTAAPAFLVFLVMGALVPRGPEARARPLAPAARTAAMVLLLLLAPRFAVQSARELWADSLYGPTSGTAALERALRANPSDYAAHMLLAEAWLKQDRCDLATPHAVSAFKLFPTAIAPVRLMVRCNPSLQSDSANAALLALPGAEPLPGVASPRR